MPRGSYRGWQNEAFAHYLTQLESGAHHSLWEATPGAGKTAAALRVIQHQLETKRASSVLVVVPTSHLRIQWSRAAAQIGLQLDSNFAGGRTRLTADFHGAVVTYQQIGHRAQAFRDLATRSIVILDEVHHTGDGLSWGKAVRSNLEKARFILCLSGTAFRSDNNPIPFVRYDKEGVSSPDYSYDYARAVEEGVCRPTAVFTYGGDVSWLENRTVISASFSDKLEGAPAARRLRAAIDAESKWITPMLKDAHEMLLATRQEHPSAGGLIVCADQTHARQIARLLAGITGEKPTIVLSDDAGASKKIKTFADRSDLWLVACNMVSEGVDIPRLRVGVYATTIRTKMYFRQFLGRIVRRQSEVTGLQVAYLYLPADSHLSQLAEEIESECRHFLNKPSDSAFERERKSSRNSDELAARWQPLSAVNSGVEAVIVHGNQLALFGANALPGVNVREVVHREVQQTLEERLTRSEEKSRIATQIKHQVAHYHRRSGKPHSVIHSYLNKAQNVKSQTHCTEEQLRERLSLLDSLCQDRDPFRERRKVPGNTTQL